MIKFYLTITLTVVLFCFSCGEEQRTPSVKGPVKQELKTAFGTVKFDQSITGFKFTIKMDNKSLYSPNGPDDLNNEKTKSGFYFKPLIGMDYERSKSYLQEFSLEYGEQEGILKTENITNKVIDVGNCKGFLITFTVIDNVNKTSFLTQAILSNEKDAILFVGNDVENGAYSEKFLETIKSIEF